MHYCFVCVVMTTSGQRVATVSASQVPTIAKGLIRLQPIVASTVATTPVTVNNLQLKNCGPFIKRLFIKDGIIGCGQGWQKNHRQPVHKQALC